MSSPKTFQDHVEGYLELSAKTKTYFTTAVQLWDADFYVKVDDDVHVNIGKKKFFVDSQLPPNDWYIMSLHVLNMSMSCIYAQA